MNNRRVDVYHPFHKSVTGYLCTKPVAGEAVDARNMLRSAGTCAGGAHTFCQVLLAV